MIFKKFFVFSLVVSLIKLSLVCNAAEISLRKTAWDAPSIHISGVIIKGDFDKLISKSHDILRGGNKIIISLDSEGGDFLEAIKIGDFIQKLHAQTYLNPTIGKNQSDMVKCHSACFIIFVSGSIRDHGIGDNMVFDVSGNKLIKKVPPLGIHRPYLSPLISSKLSPSEMKELYRNIESVTRKYLADLSIPNEIIEQMFRTSSDEMYLIDSDVFSKKIGGTQPFYDEWEKALCKNLNKKEFDDLATILTEQIVTGKKYPKKFDKKYINGLIQKEKEISLCRKEAIFNFQKMTIIQYIKSIDKTELK